MIMIKEIGVCVLAVHFAGLFSHSVSAEISYEPILPQFGGSNYQALQVMQFEKGIADSKQAKIVAKQRELDREIARLANVKTPADRLVESLTSVLQVRLAQGFADQILTGDEQADFMIGDVGINYTRFNGLLSLTIIDENGIKTLIELPVS